MNRYSKRSFKTFQRLKTQNQPSKHQGAIDEYLKHVTFHGA